MSLFTRQVEELVLLRCSLLPNEILEFAFSSPEDIATWTKIVDAGNEGELIQDLNAPCAAHFIIKIRGATLWFEFILSNEYPWEPSAFQVMVRGYDVSRAEQQRWQDIVQEKCAQLNHQGVEFPIFELVSVHLFPLLHAEFDPQSGSFEEKSNTPVDYLIYSHALLTSHHLKSPQKRRSLQKWSSELRLRGFAKVGHPGIIYCSGIQSDVAEFVSRVKDMQWLALRVRFQEPLEGMQTEDNPCGSWIELHKVGEVIEEMKRLGRESYVLELGIGSGGG